MAKNKKQKRKAILKAKKMKQYIYKEVQSSFRINTKGMTLEYLNSLITLFDRKII